MRTPLNCIVAMLQILSTQVPAQLAEEYISPSSISCDFLLHLVQDLLDMTEMESDKFTINYEEFDVRILISGIIELFKMQATAKNAELIYEIPNSVPEIIVSDYRRIRQILINLIGNSMKFLKKSNGKITVNVSLKPKNPSHIIFAVQDNGIGISGGRSKKAFYGFWKNK